MIPPDGHELASNGSVVPYVLHDGEPFMLGALPMPKGMVSAMPKFSAVPAFPLIPRNKWASLSYAAYRLPIANQGRTNSCVGHGSWGAYSKARLITNATYREFSTCSVYALLQDGHDTGAVTSYAADVLKNQGICLYSDVPEGMINQSEFPPGAMQTALRFRADNILVASNWDELISGLLYDFIPFFDFYVGSNFANLDSRGIAPAGRSRSNHCMYADGVKIGSDGTVMLDSINSWGKDFGMDGRCFLTESHFQSGNQILLIQSVADDPQETNVPFTETE